MLFQALYSLPRIAASTLLNYSKIPKARLERHEHFIDSNCD